MDVVSACLFGFDAIIVPFFVGEQQKREAIASRRIAHSKEMGRRNFAEPRLKIVIFRSRDYKTPPFPFAVSLRIWMKRLVAQLVVPIIRHSIHDSRRCRELRCAEKTGHVLSVLREDAAPESS